MDTPLLDNVLLRGLLLLPGINDSTHLINRANNVGRAPIAGISPHTFSLSLADRKSAPPVPKQNAPPGQTITGAVEFCDLILLKSARSLATTSVSLRVNRSAPYGRPLVTNIANSTEFTGYCLLARQLCTPLGIAYGSFCGAS